MSSDSRESVAWDDLEPETQQTLAELGRQDGAIEASDEEGRKWTLQDLLSVGLTRREALAVIGAIASGAAFSTALRSSVGTAEASHGGGQVGESADRVDVFAHDVDANEVNNAIRVSSESDLTGLSSGQHGVIPPETTVNISSRWQPPDDVTLDILGTLRQADGADLNATIIGAGQVQDLTIRLFGTIDGNQGNQTASTTGLITYFNNGTTEPKGNKIYGPGEVTGMQGNNVLLDNGGQNNYFGGFVVTSWVPNNTADTLISWQAGNDTCEGLVVEGLRFRGSTFGGTAGDGDIISGNRGDQTGAAVRGCEFFDIPRRGIQGPDAARYNYADNVAGSGGGGDFIASVRAVVENTLFGTFDGNGDNGIIMRTPGVCVGNHVEGFSNNGILVVNPGGNTQLLSVVGNVLIDNDQGTNSNSNLELRAVNSTGKCTAAFNTCWGDATTPTNGVKIESNFSDSWVFGNVAHGHSTNINDNSPSSTTLNQQTAETANAEEPQGTYPVGTVVDFTDSGDGSGTGVYIQVSDGTWVQIGS